MRLFFILHFLAALLATASPAAALQTGAAQPAATTAAPVRKTVRPVRDTTNTAPQPVSLPRDMAVWLTVAIDGGLVVVTLALAGLLVFAVKRMADGMRESGIAVESHWGGYGGSAGGWRLSPAGGHLLTIVVLACLLALLV
ncbi:MAG TPA: hypothetical protein VF705_12105, partial [Longimicrobium sp.]